MAKHTQLSRLSILGIIIAIIGLAITLYAITQNTEFRQRAAEEAILYITGNPQVATSGQSLDVSLDTKTNSALIQSVTVILTYPESKLSFQTISFNNSPFDIPLENLHGNGYVRISRNASSPVNGKNHIATLHFMAKEEVDLTEIKPVSGTSIMDTEKRNIFTNAVSHQITPSNTPPIFSIQFFFKLFTGIFGK